MEYVEGTEMTVYTDHSALTWLFKQKDLSGRLARWILSLQQHHMKIKHLKRKNNVVADAISRFPIVQILEVIELLDFLQPTSDISYENLLGYGIARLSRILRRDTIKYQCGPQVLCKRKSQELRRTAPGNITCTANSCSRGHEILAAFP